jgi:hypothetical protein
VNPAGPSVLWLANTLGITRKVYRALVAAGRGAPVASGRIIARSGHAYESKYWCEQDINWLRANADQIMVHDHTSLAPASGSRRSSRHPRAVIAATSR